MNNAFGNGDLVARYSGDMVWIILGIIGLTYYPHRIRKQMAIGLLTESQGKTRLKRIRAMSYFCIGVGLLSIFKVV
jgi:hypothetical protein